MRYPAYKKTAHQSPGFTLVELLVALSLFSIVSTISIGSLITLMDNNRELRDDQALITNIGFVLDMMSRDIRTGVNYYCRLLPTGQQNSNSFLPSDPDGTNDCTAPSSASAQPNHWHGLSFVSAEAIIAETNDRIVFYYDRSDNMLYRRFNNGTPQALVSDQVDIVDAYFVVSDTDSFSDDPGADNRQPTVTIFLEVRGDDGNEHQLQTTVTQRVLDI